MKRYIRRQEEEVEAKPRRILRLSEVRARLGGLGPTAMEQNFFATRRSRKIKFGRRATGCLEADVDQLIAELAAESEEGE